MSKCETEKNKKNKRMNFLEIYSISEKVKPLTGKQVKGYEINKISKGINSEMPGNDR